MNDKEKIQKLERVVNLLSSCFSLTLVTLTRIDPHGKHEPAGIFEMSHEASKLLREIDRSEAPKPEADEIAKLKDKMPADNSDSWLSLYGIINPFDEGEG